MMRHETLSERSESTDPTSGTRKPRKSILGRADGANSGDQGAHMAMPSGCYLAPATWVELIGDQVPVEEREAVERLLEGATVVGPRGCWISPLKKSWAGYAVVSVREGDNWRQVRGHRLTSAALRGIPLRELGPLLRHLCQGPRACVNPWHTALGTHKQNVADAMIDGTFRPYGRRAGK